MQSEGICLFKPISRLGRKHIFWGLPGKSSYEYYSKQETYSFLNIGGVITEEKGKGYGRQVMLAIREYLTAADKTGLGFCWPKNQGFYEKCGFSVDTKSTPRFIYREGNKEYTAERQYILYLDSNDRFMKKVLANSDQEVLVPDPTIW